MRQLVKWDQAYAKSNGGPPTSAFPASTPPDTWIEDRDQTGKRYGHRSGPFSGPQPNCVDEYKTGKVRDQANGDTWCGQDEPHELVRIVGEWQFRLDVIDTCNGDAVKASSAPITIKWG